MEEDVQSQPVWRWRSVLCIFLFPALGGLLFGYDIGATAYVLTQLEDTWDLVDSNTVLQGAITSSGVGGAFVGSVIIFKIADEIGRNREMVWAAMLYMVGAVLESTSAFLSETSGIGVLLAGRWIFGLGCGFAMHGAPTYIAEMAPAEVRGTLVSLKEAMIVVGMLLGYIVGFAMEHHSHGWAVTYGVAVVPAIAMLAGVSTLPQSARWLVLREQLAEASRAVDYMYSSGAEAVFRDMLHQSNAVGSSSERKEPIFSRTYRRALVAGLGIVTLQQVTGQPSILYYTNQIFDDAGLASYAAVLTGAFKLIATLGSVAVVDRYGRRWLLFVGVSVMLVALAIMTTAFAGYHRSTDDDDDDDDGGAHFTPRSAAIIIGMFIYIGGYQVSFGPIAWLLISEIFPLEVRGEAIALAVQSNFGWNLIVSFCYPLIVQGFASVFGEDYSYCAAFSVFGALTVYSLWFIYWHVPETKGLTLEEIATMLRRRPQSASQDRNKEPLSYSNSSPLLS